MKEIEVGDMVVWRWHMTLTEDHVEASVVISLEDRSRMDYEVNDYLVVERLDQGLTRPRTYSISKKNVVAVTDNPFKKKTMEQELTR